MSTLTNLATGLPLYDVSVSQSLAQANLLAVVGHSAAPISLAIYHGYT
jgi:hypothetical protein